MMIQFLFFTCVTVLYFFFKLHCFSNQLDFECVVVFFVFFYNILRIVKLWWMGFKLQTCWFFRNPALSSFI